MKYLFPFVFFILFFSVQEISAQQHEIGIRMSSLNNFGLIYKKQKNEQSWTRLRLLFANLNFNFLENNNQTQLTTGIAYGWEKRRSIDERLTFIHGFEPRLSMRLEQSEITNTTSYQVIPALGYVLGVQVKLKNQFFMYAEIIPALSSRFEFSNNTVNTNLGIGLSTNGASIGVVYRFAKD